jgi:hypothetical protein
MFQQNHESNPETETKNGYEKDKTWEGMREKDRRERYRENSVWSRGR